MLFILQCSWTCSAVCITLALGKIKSEAKISEFPLVIFSSWYVLSVWARFVLQYSIYLPRDDHSLNAFGSPASQKLYTICLHSLLKAFDSVRLEISQFQLPHSFCSISLPFIVFSLQSSCMWTDRYLWLIAYIFQNPTQSPFLNFWFDSLNCYNFKVYYPFKFPEIYSDSIWIK